MDKNMEKQIALYVESHFKELFDKYASSFNHKLVLFENDRKETIAICKRLGAYMENVEARLNHYVDNGGDRNSILGTSLPSNGTSSDALILLQNRVSLLEQTCGYDFLAESNRALNVGSSDVILESRTINARLDKIENLFHLNERFDKFKLPETNYSNNNGASDEEQPSGEDDDLHKLFLPTNWKQKRAKSRESNRRPYSTPHPPGYKSLPTSTRAANHRQRNSSSNNSSPTKTQQFAVVTNLKKSIEEIRSQLEDAFPTSNNEDKNMLNVIHTVKHHEEKLGELENALHQLHEQTRKDKQEVHRILTDLKSKISSGEINRPSHSHDAISSDTVKSYTDRINDLNNIIYLEEQAKGRLEEKSRRLEEKVKDLENKYVEMEKLKTDKIEELKQLLDNQKNQNDESVVERMVEPAYIRPKGTGNKSNPFASNDDDDVNVNLKGGDRVEARYGVGDKYFGGVIRTVNRDGTFVIDYDDGDHEDSVDPSLVRPKDGGASRSSSPSKMRRRADDDQEPRTYQVGDEVEARYKKGSKWLQGKIIRVGRGSYDIRYDVKSQDLLTNDSSHQESIAAIQTKLDTTERKLRSEISLRETVEKVNRDLTNELENVKQVLERYKSSSKGGEVDKVKFEKLNSEMNLLMESKRDLEMKYEKVLKEEKSLQIQLDNKDTEIRHLNELKKTLQEKANTSEEMLSREILTKKTVESKYNELNLQYENVKKSQGRLEDALQEEKQLKLKYEHRVNELSSQLEMMKLENRENLLKHEVQKFNELQSLIQQVESLKLQNGKLQEEKELLINVAMEEKEAAVSALSEANLNRYNEEQANGYNDNEDGAGHVNDIGSLSPNKTLSKLSSFEYRPKHNVERMNSRGYHKANSNMSNISQLENGRRVVEQEEEKENEHDKQLLLARASLQEEVDEIQHQINDNEIKLQKLTKEKQEMKTDIKNWIKNFEKTNGRSPAQEDKEKIADKYLAHQEASQRRTEVEEQIAKLREEYAKKREELNNLN